MEIAENYIYRLPTNSLGTLQKICKYYEQFDEIFGSKFIESNIIEETLQSDNDTEVYEIEETDTNETSTVTECSPFDFEVLASNSRKGIYSRTAVSDIMQVQSEMVAIKKQKLDQDLAIKEREMNMKEREVVVKEKEMELKEKEIISNEKIKILELEMKERVAMEELKRKYK